MKIKSKHLIEENISYFSHFIRAWKFNIKIVKCFIALSIHSIIPELFKTYSSRTIIQMSDEFKTTKV
jgi:hypothetical protein